MPGGFVEQTVLWEGVCSRCRGDSSGKNSRRYGGRFCSGFVAFRLKNMCMRDVFTQEGRYDVHVNGCGERAPLQISTCEM